MRILGWPAFKNKSSNPYNWLLYTGIEKQGHTVRDYCLLSLIKSRYDVLHIHWPDYQLTNKKVSITFLRIVNFFFVLILAKLKKTKIIWSVHNLHSHERTHPKIEAFFWNWFHKYLDGIICLTETGCNEALKKYPALGNVPSFVVPHGHYKNIYPNHISKESSRNFLGIRPDANVFLFVGAIRTYKNIPHLIKVFNNFNDQNSVLIVAGKSNDLNLLEDIYRLSADDPRIFLKLHFIADDQIQVFLNSADLVVLPYSEILNSGSALLALSYDRPVLVPDRGAMKDLRNQLDAGWIFCYEDELSPAVLKDALDQSKALNNSHVDLSNLDWDIVSKMTLNVYEHLILQ